MEIKLFEGDYVDLRKYGIHVLPKEILIYMDENNIKATSIWKSLNRVMIAELYRSNMAKMLIFIEGKQKPFIGNIPTDVEVIREYKIINVNENLDQQNRTFLIVDMARIERDISEDWDDSFKWNNLFRLDDLDTFIFPLDSSVAKQIENNPTENIFLRFSEYDEVQILFDGVPRRVYKYLGGIMNDPKDWKSLCLKKANPGNFVEEEIIFKFLSNLGGYTINLTNDKLLVFNDNETIIDSELEKIEEDAFSISYIGILNIGVKFRLVTASSMAANIIKAGGDKPMATFGSLSPSGYAVTYELY